LFLRARPGKARLHFRDFLLHHGYFLPGPAAVVLGAAPRRA
jgi:hypothetical protein